VEFDQIDQHPLQAGGQFLRCVKSVYFCFCATLCGAHTKLNVR